MFLDGVPVLNTGLECQSYPNVGPCRPSRVQALRKTFSSMSRCFDASSARGRLSAIMTSMRTKMTRRTTRKKTKRQWLSAVQDVFEAGCRNPSRSDGLYS